MNKKNSLKKLLKEILKGDFLVKEDAYKSWKFLLFLTSLALISVTSSHMMDNKVRELSNLNETLKELKSEQAEIQTELVKKQLKIYLEEKVRPKGLENLSEPPFELIIDQDELID